jgi:hypothetical protein
MTSYDLHGTGATHLSTTTGIQAILVMVRQIRAYHHVLALAVTTLYTQRVQLVDYRFAR